MSATLHRLPQEKKDASGNLVGKHPEEPFKHTPLDDPKNQVRLLELKPGQGDDAIECSLSVCDRPLCVAYEAISYTWGEPYPARTIYIDRKPLEVGENCWFALWQVRLLKSSRVIWIDAICIDQRNSNEKGHQVQEMSGVFRNATSTLVSLGDVGEEGDFLLDWMSVFANTNDQDFPKLQEWVRSLLRVRGIVTGKESLRAWYADGRRAFWAESFLEAAWTETLRQYYVAVKTPIDAFKRIIKAFIIFTSRPYWTRLWVHPELSLSKNAIFYYSARRAHKTTIQKFLMWLRMVKAGHDLNAIILPEDFLQIASRWSHNLPMDAMFLRVDRCKENPSSFGTLGGCQYHELPHLGCSDPRDRIFALVPLIDWHSRRFQPIIVDYNKTRFGLVLETIKFCPDFEAIENLIRSLKIGCQHTDNDMVAFLDVRKKLQGRDWNEAQQCDVEKSSCGAAPFKIKLYRNVRYWQLGRGPSGELVADSIPPGVCFQSRAGIDRLSFEEYYPELRSTSLQVLQPSGEMAAVVPSNTLPGDIIVKNVFSEREAENEGLVLRPSEGGIYEIVGHALIWPKYPALEDHTSAPKGQSANFSMEAAQCSGTRTFEFRISAEDALVFVLRGLACSEECPERSRNSSWSWPLGPLSATRFTNSRFSSYAVQWLTKGEPLEEICANCGEVGEEDLWDEVGSQNAGDDDDMREDDSAVRL